MKLKNYLCILAVGISILGTQQASADDLSSALAELARAGSTALSVATQTNEQIQSIASNPNASAYVKGLAASSASALSLANQAYNNIFFVGTNVALFAEQITITLNNCYAVTRNSLLIANEMAGLDFAATSAYVGAVVKGSAVAVATLESIYLYLTALDYIKTMEEQNAADIRTMTLNISMIKNITTTYNVDLVAEDKKLQNNYNQAGTIGFCGYLNTAGAMYMGWLAAYSPYTSSYDPTTLVMPGM